MRKRLCVFLMLIFLPVCASLGALGQAQGFILGAENGVLLSTGPIGSAQSTNVAVVCHNQQSTDPYHFVTALQCEGGVLIQGAYAIGMEPTPMSSILASGRLIRLAVGPDADRKVTHGSPIATDWAEMCFLMGISRTIGQKKLFMV